MKDNESKIIPFPGRRVDFQDNLQKVFAKMLPLLSEADTSNQENIIRDNNSMQDNSLIDYLITTEPQQA